MVLWYTLPTYGMRHKSQGNFRCSSAEARSDWELETPFDGFLKLQSSLAALSRELRTRGARRSSSRSKKDG